MTKRVAIPPRMRGWLLKHAVLAAFFISPILTGTANAQVTEPSPEESVGCFEESYRSGVIPSECERGVLKVEAVVSSWHRFAPAFLDGILDGLERQALMSDSKRVRISAAVFLLSPGKKIAPPSLPGVVERGMRVYRASNEYAVKRAIVSGMTMQAERARAVAFLMDVAREDPPEERHAERSLAYDAVTHLAYMGEEGRAALQQLHAGGRVKNRQARGYLENLSKISFEDPTVDQVDP